MKSFFLFVFFLSVFGAFHCTNGQVIDFEQSWIDAQQVKSGKAGKKSTAGIKSVTGIKRVGGKFYKAWDFYHSDKPVILDKGYALSDDFTLEVWINLSDCSDESVIFSSYAWNKFRVSIKAGKLLYVKLKSYDYLCEYDFVTGRWYHIAITYSSEQGFRAYINGKVVIADRKVIANAKKYRGDIDLRVIGAYSVNGKGAFDHYFKGLIDRPRFCRKYSDYLRIQKLYYEGINKLPIVPIPQQVFARKGKAFKISDKVSICLDTNLLAKDDPGVIELIDQLSKSCSVILKKSFIPADGMCAIIFHQADSKKDNIPSYLRKMLREKLPADGFVVSVRKGRIDLIADNARGLFYAIQCLKQLLKQPVISPVDIYDYPTFPYRACLYVNDNEPPTKLDYHLKKLIRYLAKYRVRYIMLRIHDWVELDQKKVAYCVRQISDYAKKYHLEVIPYLQCYGHAKAFLWKDLRCGHTVTIRDEPIVLNDKPVPLSHKNVIITQNTPVIVRDANGRMFIEGRDYELIEGELKTRWYFPKESSFRWWWAKPYICKDNKPWKIKRIESGRIKSGQKVFVTYDVASNGEGYCPFSEYTRKVLGETVTNIVNLLHPEYINLGMDEIWQPRGKGRCCSHNNMTAGQTIAYEMNTACRQIKKIEPQLKVLVFSDMLDERQTPAWKATLDTPELIEKGLIDKRLIMMPWYYGCRISDALYIRQSTKWFLSNGYRVIGTAGVAPINMFLWGQCLSSLRGRYNVEGFTYTLWAASKKHPPLAGLAAYAQNSWSPARLPLVETIKLRLMLNRMGIIADLGDEQIAELLKEKRYQSSPELKQLWRDKQDAIRALLRVSVDELKETNFEQIKGIQIAGLEDIIAAIRQAKSIIKE